MKYTCTDEDGGEHTFDLRHGSSHQWAAETYMEEMGKDGDIESGESRTVTVTDENGVTKRFSVTVEAYLAWSSESKEVTAPKETL